jgi:hypothetical protein
MFNRKLASLEARLAKIQTLRIAKEEYEDYIEFFDEFLPTKFPKKNYDIKAERDYEIIAKDGSGSAVISMKKHRDGVIKVIFKNAEGKTKDLNHNFKASKTTEIKLDVAKKFLEDIVDTWESFIG